ncbi:hypothetical protein QN355_09120 [Cryobacterium sp. 10S3]|uniref:DUF6804 family protein n=1 Tax=unclassified Cryobacterium TaxID=2649013 RepID=UPI002AC8E163|nr:MULTISPECIES: DUF6804 family protein [unclassified Cryobacterium]MEB0001678.1 hypothetical protein [Cryobacterium sp. RTC2.1]MEB0286710.1 hypothetical protein [Cryobacterium sp. 10S3]WPX13169.1 hypothetical protein RHM57_16090 [Cryobacterium sp. 10S3]
MSADRDLDKGVLLDRYPALVAATASAGVLLVGAFDLPFGYYQFLRYVVTVGAVLLAVFALRAGHPRWLGLFLPMIVLWAPADVIRLPQPVWVALDLAVAGLFIVAGFAIPAPAPSKTKGVSSKPSVPMAWWMMTAIAVGIGLAIWMMAGSSGTGNPDCVTTYDRYASCE